MATAVDTDYWLPIGGPVAQAGWLGSMVGCHHRIHRVKLSCAAASIFLQLHLYPAVHISFSRSLFQVFIARPLPQCPCGVHCSACLVMLSSFLLNVCPSQLHFLLHIWSSFCPPVWSIFLLTTHHMLLLIVY